MQASGRMQHDTAATKQPKTWKGVLAAVPRNKLFDWAFWRTGVGSIGVPNGSRDSTSWRRCRSMDIIPWDNKPIPIIQAWQISEPESGRL